MAIRRSIVAALVLAALAAPALAQEQSHENTPPKNRWSFAGPFGKFDRGQLQRGLKVYREVCSVCHGLKMIAFRNLADPGGPEFTTAQAQAIAAEYKVQDGPNDQGEMFERPGRRTASPRHSRTTKRRAPATTRYRPIFPSSPRRAATSGGFRTGCLT